MMSMFCPACGAHMVGLQGTIISIHRHPIYGVRYEFKYDVFVVCGNCPVVSTVNQDTGRLTDLNLSIADLICPPQERDRPIPGGRAWAALLHGRKDS